MKIEKISLIVSPSATDIQKQIMDWQNSYGFELLGAVQVCTRYDHQINFCATMVKYKENE